MSRMSNRVCSLWRKVDRNGSVLRRRSSRVGKRLLQSARRKSRYVLFVFSKSRSGQRTMLTTRLIFV